MLFVWWLVGETTLALLLISTGVIGFERAKKLPRWTVRFGIRYACQWPGWEPSSYGPKTLPDSCPERDRIGHKLGWHVLEDGISPTLVGGYATPVLGNPTRLRELSVTVAIYGSSSSGTDASRSVGISRLGDDFQIALERNIDIRDPSSNRLRINTRLSPA